MEQKRGSNKEDFEFKFFVMLFASFCLIIIINIIFILLSKKNCDRVPIGFRVRNSTVLAQKIKEYKLIAIREAISLHKVHSKFAEPLDSPLPHTNILLNN